jgi:LysR family carnitine catabolism transcriptional activator
MALNLSTRELRAFVALAEQRSFTRAASHTALSQPAFSALIRGLEESLGARLFHRTTRSVELTVEGRVFLDAARRLLAGAEAAHDDLLAHAASRRGRAALALLPSLAAGWLPPLLAEFHARHPGVELSVADVLSDDCIARVRDGRADFALASTRAEAAELRTEPFCRDRFHVVCRRDHPLARRRGPLTLNDIAPHPIVQLARSSSVRQYVEAALYPMQLHTMMELDQLATVAGMVRAGLGITIVPSLTLFHFADARLATRPLHTPALVRNVYVVRRADRPLSSAASGLHEMLIAAKPRAMPRRAA